MLNELSPYLVMPLLILAWIAGAMAEKREADRLRVMLEHDRKQTKELLNDVYHQRNMVVMLAAKQALASGLQAGWALALDADDDPEWSHVVYVDLPGGGQISYHLAPAEIELFKAQLPEYPGVWDGTGKEQHHALITGLKGQPHEKQPLPGD